MNRGLCEELHARLWGEVLAAGLLECPLSTRIEKVVDGGYTVMSGPGLRRALVWENGD